MGQAPILAFMCYEKLLKFFGKRKPRKSADRSHDDRRNFPVNTCRPELRCRCYDRPVTLTIQPRNVTMTKGRDSGQEKSRTLYVHTNSNNHARSQVVHTVQAHRIPFFRQDSPSYPSHQNSISSYTPKRKSMEPMTLNKPVSPVTNSCRSCQLAHELCLRQEGINRDFVMDLPRTVARPDDVPLRWPSRTDVSLQTPPSTICHPPPNLNPFVDTQLAPSEHL